MRVCPILVSSAVLTGRCSGAAGYSPKTATVQASQLLTKLNIQHAVQQASQKTLDAVEVTKDELLRSLKHLLHLNIKRFYDADGKPKNVHELSDEDAECVDSVQVILKNAEAGDGHI